MLDKLKSIVLRQKVEAKTQKGSVDRLEYEGSSLSTSGPRPSANIIDALVSEFPSEEITVELAAKIYKRSPYINASIRLIADQASIVPFGVFRRNAKNNELTPVFRGEPYNMLRWVNPNMSFSEFISYITAWYKLIDNAFCVVEETPTSVKSPSKFSIYPLNPMYIKIVPDPDLGYKGIIYDVNGKKIFYPRDRIIHFKNFSPDNHWWGCANLEALGVDIQIERFGKKQAQNYFSNAAMISGVLKVPAELNEDEVGRLEKMFYQNHSGAKNAYRVMVLTEGMEYDALKSSLSESNTTPIIDQSLHTFAAVFGVPISLLHGETDQHSNDLVDTEAWFWKKTMIPLLNKIADVMTKKLAYPIADDLVLLPDLRSIDSLRIHNLDKTRVDVARASTGLNTPNEIRTDRGEPPHEDEEFGNTPFPVWQAKQQEKMAVQAQEAAAEQAKATASLSLPADKKRNQSKTGEAQMVDTSAKKSIDDIVDEVPPI